MTYDNRETRRQEAAMNRLEGARRAALTRAIGALTEAHQMPAAEILRRMLSNGDNEVPSE